MFKYSYVLIGLPSKTVVRLVRTTKHYYGGLTIDYLLVQDNLWTI